MLSYIVKVLLITFGIPSTLIAAYLLNLHRKVSPHVVTETKLRRSPTDKSLCSIRKPTYMPLDAARDDSEWFLAYERVASRPLHVSLLHLEKDAPLSSTLTRYIRATMTAFGDTPAASGLKRTMPKEAAAAVESFSQERIQSLDFDVGDLVYGVYRVTHRGNGSGDAGKSGERVELVIEPPAGYRGPMVEGGVVVGVERVDENHVIFVNESWWWRRPGDKRKFGLEGLERWVHMLMSSWLVAKGVDAMLKGEKEKDW